MSTSALVDVAELVTYFRGDTSDLKAKAAEARQISQQAAQQMNEAMRSAGNFGALGAAVQAQTRSMSQAITGVSDSLISMGSSMRRVGADLAVVAAPLGLLGGLALKTGVGFDAMKQQAMIAFTTMLGGADQARAMLENLTDFAAKTPFELRGLIPLTQQLIAFGFAGDDVIPMLTSIGDAIAGLGKGEPEMQRLILNLGQIKALGRLTGRELRDMSTLGIPAIQILADTMGKSTAQMQKMVSDGLVPADFAIKALIDGLEKGTANTVAFGGMMDAQSRTLLGIMSNLKDTADKTLGAIFQPLVDKATPALLEVQKRLAEFGKAVEQIGLLPALAKFTGLSESFLKVAGALAAVAVAAGPVTFAIGLLTTAVGALVSPIGLVIVALAGLAAAYASNFAGIRDTINSFAADVKTFWTNWGDEIVTIFKIIWGQVADVTKTGLSTVGSVMRAGGALLRGDLFGPSGFFFNIGDAIINLFQPIIDQVVNIWNELGIQLKKSAIAMFSILTAIFRVGVGDFQGAWEELRTTIPALWDDTVNDIQRSAEGLAENLGVVGGQAGSAFAGNLVTSATANIGPWQAGIMSEAEAIKAQLAQEGLLTGAAWAREFTSQVSMGVSSAVLSMQQAERERRAIEAAQRGVTGVRLPLGTIPMSDQYTQFWKGVADGAKQYSFAVGDTVAKVKPKLTDLAGAHVKAGAAARTMLNEFKDGAAGLDQAIAQIGKETASLPTLFDPMSKGARKNAADTVAALKVVAPAMQDFFKTMGADVKVTAEMLAAGWEKFAPSVEKLQAFTRLKEAINAIQVDQVIKGLGTFDDSLKVVNGEIQISQPLLAALGKGYSDLVAKAENAGLKLKAVWPTLSADALGAAGDVTVSSQEVERAMEVWMDSITKTTAVSGELMTTWEKVSAEAPHWAGSIVDVANKITGAVDNLGEVLRTRAAIDINETFDGIINDALRLGEQLGKTGDDLIKFAESSLARATQELKEKFPEFAAEIEKGAKDAVERFRKEMYRLPGALDEVFNKLAAGAKKQMSGVFEIINALPGQFGDALRKTTNVILDWINRIDQILKGLHKIFKSVPDGLADMLGQLVGIFKKSQGTIKPIVDGFGSDWLKAGKTAQTAGSTISQAWAKAGEGVKIAAGGAAGALAAFTTAMSVTAATGSKTAGIITGGIQSALTGFIASLTLGGPAGAIIGGISFLGSIFGSLFGGKSALQKAQEAAAIQKAKDDIKLSMQAVQKGAQEVIQTAIKTMTEALAFFEKLDAFTAVRKEIFRKFFAALGRLMDYFVELAGKWSTDSIKKAKELGEGMIPVVEAAGKGLEVLDGLSNFVPVAESAIVAFGDNLGRLVEKMGTVFEGIPKALIKHARKFANNLESVAQVIGPLIEGMSSLLDFRPATEAMIQTFADTLRELIDKMGELAEEMDFAMVKAAARFAEKAAIVVSLISEGVSALAALGTLSAVPGTAFDALFAGVKEMVVRMQDIAAVISIDLLAKAQLIAEKSLAIFSALKAAIEVLTLSQQVGQLPDFSALREFMRGAIQAVIDVANEFAEGAVAGASQFSASAKTVVEFFGQAGGILKSLDNVFAVGFDFAFIKNATKGMIELVIALAEEMGTVGVAAAAGFAKASSDVVTFMTNTANAFKALREAGAVTVQNVIDLVSGFKLLIERLSFMARELGPDGITQAVQLAGQLTVILSSITQMAATMTAIANARWPEQAAWDDFVSSVGRMVGALEASLGQMLDGQALAAQIRDAAQEIAADIGEAASLLGDVSGEFGGEVGVSGLAVPAPGAAPLAAPLGFGQSAASTTIQVYVAGSVLTQGPLEDAIIAALQRADRRGRFLSREWVVAQ